MNEPRTTPPSSIWVKAAITVVGSLVVLAGVIMLAIPGPGLLTIAAGLVILGREYHWARRLLGSVKERIRKAAEKATRKK